MVQKNEKQAVKKTVPKEKAPASREKKAASRVTSDAAVHPAETGKVEAPKKKATRVRKKTVAAPEAGREDASKTAKKPRVRVKKEASHPVPGTAAEAVKAPEKPVHPVPPVPHAGTAAPRPEKHPKAHVPHVTVEKHTARPDAKPENKHEVKHHPAHHAPAAPAHKPPVSAAPAPAHAPAVPAAKAPVKAPAVPQAPVKPPVAQPAAPQAQKAPSKGTIKINELITVRELAEKMHLSVVDVMKKLLQMGSMATINQRLDQDTATIIVHEFAYEAKFDSLYAEEETAEEIEDPAKMKARPPVVTIMGHVDHGKTSLLDAIRQSDVAGGEAGGITQHIGAYRVKTSKGEVAFLDTPGHEAFTAMRSRGAQATDLVVLVVSAADGVMPQTVEAIDHARAANVPIIVAINKMDLPTANPSQVKQELGKYNLVSEDWGGDTIMVEVSAKKKTNINLLLEMLLLKAEMMELKANPDKLARGVVIEAKLDSRRGPVATVLVQSGTLKVGDNFVAGNSFGKVRAMLNEHGVRGAVATPSTPVEILGINSAPQAGDQFVVVEQESQAREIAEARREKAHIDSLRPRHHLSLEDISQGKVKELRIILKADVQGSLEALSDSLERLSTSEITLRVIHRGVGSITESDVTLAAASDAFIIGFNMRPESSVEKLADQEGVSIRAYRIIYEVIADVKAAMEGLLEPSIKQIVIGKAQVKQIFRTPKAGTIAGSMVLDGKIQRGAKIRVLRDNVIAHEGEISSLRRFKDDVKEVEKGHECGIGIENFSDIKPGDSFEAFIEEKVARKL